MASIDQLIAMFTNAQNQSNAANQQRLDEILAMLDQQAGVNKGYLDQAGSLFADRIGLLEGMGETAKTDVRRASEEAKGAGDQSLMDRGLFNTTVLDSQRRRQDESTGRQVGAIDESVRGQKIGAMSDWAGFLSNRAGFEQGQTLDKAGVLERVSDIGPDQGAWANLIAQLAQSQGSSGGRTFSFGGINRPPGPPNPFGNASSGGGSSGGGLNYASSIYGRDQANPNDPFANQSVQDAQAGAQSAANQSPSDPNLPVVPYTTWFQNPNMRIQGQNVYDTRTGRLLGRKGEIGR